MSRWIWVPAVLGISLLSGCARPIYEQASAGIDETQRKDEKAADCSLRFNNSHHCLSWYWEKKPVGTGVGSMIFKIYRTNLFDGTAILLDPPRLPLLQLRMEEMGHGSTPNTVVRLDVGTFRATNVRFIMIGEWTLKFQIKDGETLLDEAVVQKYIHH